MSTQMKGDLNDTLGLNRQTLLGNGNVQMNEGKLVGFPLTSKLADMTNLSELREINFKDWTNAFSISNGRFVVKDLKVSAGQIGLLVGGSQGLDGSLDYTLTVKLPESYASRLSLPGVASNLVQFFKDKDGKLALNFQVTGSASEPVLHLDTHAQQDAAKNLLQQKAGDELKKKAEEGLKSLFKRP